MAHVIHSMTSSSAFCHRRAQSRGKRLATLFGMERPYSRHHFALKTRLHFTLLVSPPRSLLPSSSTLLVSHCRWRRTPSNTHPDRNVSLLTRNINAIESAQYYTPSLHRSQNASNTLPTTTSLHVMRLHGRDLPSGLDDIRNSYNDFRSGNDSPGIENAQTASTATFVTALWINAAVFGLEIIAFTLLRKRFKAVYEPRTYIPAEK